MCVCKFTELFFIFFLIYKLLVLFVFRFSNFLNNNIPMLECIFSLVAITRIYRCDLRKVIWPN